MFLSSESVTWKIRKEIRWNQETSNCAWWSQSPEVILRGKAWIPQTLVLKYLTISSLDLLYAANQFSSISDCPLSNARSNSPSPAVPKSYKIILGSPQSQILRRVNLITLLVHIESILNVLSCRSGSVNYLLISGKDLTTHLLKQDKSYQLLSIWWAGINTAWVLG